jgi:PP-loop superfamily ATP-utilizing enzyme
MLNFNIPDLRNKNIAVMFSGGMDSMVVSALLLKKGYDICLMTVDNSAFDDVNIARRNLCCLDTINGGKIKDHIFLSSTAIFREMVIRRLSADISKFKKDYTCAGCKLGMLAVVIAYAKTHNIDIIVDGFVKAQSFYPEQTKGYLMIMPLAPVR